MIIFTEPDPEVRSKIAPGLGGGNGLATASDIGELKTLLDASGNKVDVVVLGPGIKSGEAFRFADSLQRSSPEVSVVLISHESSPELFHAALRAGVRDVVGTKAGAQVLAESVARALDLSKGLRGRNGQLDEKRDASAKVVTVFSGKGGCGKSFVSSNLAIVLARATGKEVALVDLDLSSGDLAIMLQLTPEWTIHDAAEHIDGLDSDELLGYMTPHISGTRLLAAPFEPALAEKISGNAVKTVIEVLRNSFSYVIIDGPASFNEHLLSALDETDECILLASMDVPSIKSVKVSLATLAQLGIPRERLRLVLNRADSRVGLHLSEVEKSLGTRIDVALPSSRDVPLSINQGLPLAIHNRRSPMIKALEDLARMIVGAGDESRRRFSRR